MRKTKKQKQEPLPPGYHRAATGHQETLMCAFITEHLTHGGDQWGLLYFTTVNLHVRYGWTAAEICRVVNFSVDEADAVIKEMSRKKR